MIFAGAFSSYYGLMGISLAADKHKIYNYPVLARKVLGNRWGNILDVTIILYVYGTLIGYQIMIGTFVPSISKSLGLEENESQERIIVMCVACVGIMIPLGMFKELSSFRFVSMLSGFTLLYITVLIIAEFGIFVNHNNFARVNYFDININIFSGYAFCLYSFTCHTNIAQVQGELRESNIRRTKKVALRTIVGVMVPYILLSLFGYLSVMDNTPTLIIMRQAPEELQNHDGAMVLAKVLMSITLILAVPINVPPFRTTIIRMFFKQENPSTVL